MPQEKPKENPQNPPQNAKAFPQDQPQLRQIPSVAHKHRLIEAVTEGIQISYDILNRINNPDRHILLSRREVELVDQFLNLSFSNYHKLLEIERRDPQANHHALLMQTYQDRLKEIICLREDVFFEPKPHHNGQTV